MITRGRGGFGGVLSHGQKYKAKGGFKDMKIPNFHGVSFQKKKKLNSQNNFEREPTEKKFAKDQPPKFERNKIPAKAKRGF